MNRVKPAKAISDLEGYFRDNADWILPGGADIDLARIVFDPADWCILEGYHKDDSGAE